MLRLSIPRFLKLSFLDNFLGKLIFSMGIVSSVVTQFCTMQYLKENSDNITVWYNILLGGVSVFFITFGYKFLFEKSDDDNIGAHDRGMGLVVVFISVFVVILEIVLIVMVYKHENLSTALAIYLLVFACEKIVQVAVYIAIRRCNPNPHYRRGAVFYFYFLSFLNFTLWLNSIPFTDVPIYDEVSHNHLLEYVDETFKALVIDYRLLCALLFLEHALSIDDAGQHDHVETEQDNTFAMLSKRWMHTLIGFGIGVVLLALEIANAAQFWSKSLPYFVNLFPILSDLTLCLLGLLLLNNVNISVLHDKKVNLVLFMVTSMGAASIVYLVCFGLLSFTSFRYDEPVSYVKWSACVFLARAFSLMVLLLVYAGIPVNTMETTLNHNTKNYILVSALCSGVFARFVGSILDEFKGMMHAIAEEHLKSDKLRSLEDLFTIGPLFQLATTLHLALHFLLMLWRLHEIPRNTTQIAGNEDVNENGEPAGSINDVADSPFETSGVHDLEADFSRSAPNINDRTRLLQSV